MRCGINRPKTGSDNIDRHSLVGLQPTVWYLGTSIRPSPILKYKIRNAPRPGVLP
jgi:hypothetical protein